jgi:hypothetical protein
MSKKYFSFCLFLLFFAFAFGQNYSMMIRSASVKRIYRQCENPLYFDVSNLCGEEYNPKVVATNADVKKDSASLNKFIIFPKEEKSCLLSLYNQKREEEVKLGEERVIVVDPPKPDIIVKVNGTTYIQGMGINNGSKVTLFFDADADFMRDLPLEARYSVDEIGIFVSHCGGAHRVGGCNLSGYGVKKQIEIPIPSDAFRSAGYKLYIEIKDIYRINSKGNAIKDTRFGNQEKVICLTIK